MAAPAALGAEIFSWGFRFLPTPEEAVTNYIPRLIAGEPLHTAVRPVVHHADVYAWTPADLARRFCPLPRTGDRFFFTPSAATASRKRAARPGAAAEASRVGGSWNAQNTVDIKSHRRRGDGGGGGGDDDVKIGEIRKLRYKKSGGVYTDWLMEDYSVDGDGGESQFVLCKMYVSPRAAPTSPAHQESAAYFFTQPPPPPLPPAAFMQPAPAPVPKRPAAPPQPPAMSPPCAKRMRRGPVPVLQPACVPPSQPPPCSPPVLPTRSPLAAVGKMMPFAPPQPSCAPRRGSTQPSPASAPPLAPPVPIRHAMRRHCSPMPLPARQQPLPPQKVPLLPTPPVVRACHVPLMQVPVQSKQRRVVDPFEAAVLRDEAEEQTTVAAAPHPPPPPAATTPALQDEDDWGELDEALEF